MKKLILTVVIAVSSAVSLSAMKEAPGPSCNPCQWVKEAPGPSCNPCQWVKEAPGPSCNPCQWVR